MRRREIQRPDQHGPTSAAAPALSWLVFHPFLLLAGYGLIGALP